MTSHDGAPTPSQNCAASIPPLLLAWCRAVKTRRINAHLPTVRNIATGARFSLRLLRIQGLGDTGPLDNKILTGLGRVAGLAGIALGVFLLIFQGVLEKDFLPTIGLSQDQAYRVLMALMLLTFGLAAIGLLVWFVAQAGSPGDRLHDSFVLTIAGLVVVVMAAAVYVGTTTNGQSTAPAESALPPTPPDRKVETQSDVQTQPEVEPTPATPPPSNALDIDSLQLGVTRAYAEQILGAAKTSDKGDGPQQAEDRMFYEYRGLDVRLTFDASGVATTVFVGLDTEPENVVLKNAQTWPINFREKSEVRWDELTYADVAHDECDFDVGSAASWAYWEAICPFKMHTRGAYVHAVEDCFIVVGNSDGWVDVELAQPQPVVNDDEIRALRERNAPDHEIKSAQWQGFKAAKFNYLKLTCDRDG